MLWTSYKSDLDRVYPMLPVIVEQLNNRSSNVDPISLLPTTIQSLIAKKLDPCLVKGLEPRKLILWLDDGAQFRLNYPEPFNQDLALFLNATTNVIAWEFVGERIKYGRLQRLLDNV